MKGLTDKQRNILEYIEEFSRIENMAPTVYEVAERFNIKSATAFAHLRALQRKGYVDRTSKARSLTLMRGTSPKHLSMTLSIPILGRISAGQPLLAEEHVEEIIQIDTNLLPNTSSGQGLFGLRVSGESMIDKGIMDRDIIIARQQSTALPGDIVVLRFGNAHRAAPGQSSLRFPVLPPRRNPHSGRRRGHVPNVLNTDPKFEVAHVCDWQRGQNCGEKE